MRRVLLLVACAALFAPSAAHAQSEPLDVLDGGVANPSVHWLTFGGGLNGEPVVHLAEAGLYRFLILDNVPGHNFWLTGPGPNQLVFRTVFESMELPPPPPNGPPQQFDVELAPGIYRYQCENHAFMTGWFTVGDVVVVQTETGSGFITSDPAGVNWPTNRGAAFPEGTQVTLTASPQNSSFKFNGWLYGCNGLGGCTVTVNGRTEVRALFGTPVAPTAPATISKLAVVKQKARRTVRLTLNVKRAATATAQLRKSARVLVAKTASLAPGTRVVTLAVPKRTKAGLYTVRLALEDTASGNRFTVNRSVRIPR